MSLRYFNRDRFGVSETPLGQFSTIVVGHDIQENCKPVAVRLLPDTPHNQHLHKNEVATFEALQGQPGIPKLSWHGVEFGSCILVMDALLPDLATTFELHVWGKAKHRNVGYAVAQLGIQLLDVLASLHKKGFIHRDIKPSIFALGICMHTSQVHFVSLSSATTYLSQGQFKLEHIEYEENEDAFVGDFKYASSNALRGHGLSRRDDLISLAYTLIALLGGPVALPWHDCFHSAAEIVRTEERKEIYKSFADARDNTTIEEFSSGLPDGLILPFGEILCRAQMLGFSDEPDYEAFKKPLMMFLQLNCPAASRFTCTLTDAPCDVYLDVTQFLQPRI